MVFGFKDMNHLNCQKKNKSNEVWVQKRCCRHACIHEGMNVPVSKKMQEEGPCPCKRLGSIYQTTSFAPETTSHRRSGGDFLPSLNVGDAAGSLSSLTATPAAGVGGDPGSFSQVEV